MQCLSFTLPSLPALFTFHLLLLSHFSASLSLSRQTHTLQVMAFSVKSHFNGSLSGSSIKKKSRETEWPFRHKLWITQTFNLDHWCFNAIFVRKATSKVSRLKIKICPIVYRFSSYITTRCELFADGHVELSQAGGFSMKIRADRINKPKSLRPEMSMSIIIATKHSTLFCC